MGFATTAAVIGLTTTAATTGMSFAQASKQNKLMREAESDAERALAEAKKKLDVNYYEQLGIQKEPYELEREAALSSGAQLIEAGKESERGIAATAGRVQMAQNEAQRQIASAMGQELLGLEKLTAQEESRLRDMGVGINLTEVAGAQDAAAQAQKASAAATTQGIQGVASIGQQVMNLVPLYQKTAGTRQFGNLEKGYNRAIKEGTLGSQFKDASGNPLSFQQAMSKINGFGIDMSGVGAMNPMQFPPFETNYGPQ